MTDWDAVPHFGAEPPDARLTARPSAYVLLRRGDGALAVVRAPGGVYLPGGGLAPGEDVDAALHREVREECGLRVALGPWRVRAVDRVHARGEGRFYAKQSTFVEAVATGEGEPAVEPDHVLAWVSPQQAMAELAHPGQRWAVAQWLAGARARAGAGRRSV